MLEPAQGVTQTRLPDDSIAADRRPESGRVSLIGTLAERG